MGVINFFSYVLHASASFVVALLVSSGLATNVFPSATTTNSVSQIVTATSSENVTIVASTSVSGGVVAKHAPTKDTNTPVTEIITPPVIQVPQVVSVTETTNVGNALIPSAQAAPTTITIKPDTSGFNGPSVEAFYNISSDSQSEVDLRGISFVINNIIVPTSGTVLISITDDTNSVLVTSSTANSYYNNDTKQLSVQAIFNKPLRIMSGYPTMFDIKAEQVGRPSAGQPNIVISSVGSPYILNPGRAVFLF